MPLQAIGDSQSPWNSTPNRLENTMALYAKMLAIHSVPVL